VLEECRNVNLDLGDNTGRTLKSMIMNGAHRMPTGGRNDFGRGLVNWEATIDIVRGCGANEALLLSHQRGAGVQGVD
jgi:hypothetical protein